MRRAGKWIGKALIAVAAILAVVWIVGPREPVDTRITFDPGSLGGDLDAYIKQRESRFKDIVPGAQKQIVWAGEPGAKTDVAVVYLHGWSASPAEIRPVPDRVANAIGANLFFQRMTGHGRTGEALAAATVNDWLNDGAEAMAIGRRLGHRVLLIGTSTGGTLLAEAIDQDKDNSDIIGAVFISPNFKIYSPLAALLTVPFARRLVPLIEGDTRSWEGLNPEHKKYWTNSYPSLAVLPLGAIVKHAASLDFSSFKMPALFVYSTQDRVVNHKKTRKVMAQWGGPVSEFIPDISPEDSAKAHVLTGDIISPERTDIVTENILDWFAKVETLK